MVTISKLIESLETLGHTVDCPVTGAFIVDDIDCTSIVKNPEHDNDTALEAIAPCAEVSPYDLHAPAPNPYRPNGCRDGNAPYHRYAKNHS